MDKYWSEETIERLHELAFEKARKIASIHEEVLEAFVAKYGYQPDEMVMCLQPSENKFWVEHRPSWIKCEERLPRHNQFVLAIGTSGQIEVLRFDLGLNNYVFMNQSLTHQVVGITHWMPLPKVPNE